MATSQSALSEVSLAEWDDALLENVKMLAIKLTLGTTQKLERDTENFGKYPCETIHSLQRKILSQVEKLESGSIT